MPSSVRTPSLSQGQNRGISVSQGFLPWCTGRIGSHVGLENEYKVLLSRSSSQQMGETEGGWFYLGVGPQPDFSDCFGQTLRCSSGQWPAGLPVPVDMLFHRRALDDQLFLCHLPPMCSSRRPAAYVSAFLGSWVFIGTGWRCGRPEWS